MSGATRKGFIRSCAAVAVAVLVLALPAAAGLNGFGGWGFLLASPDVQSIAVLPRGEVILAGTTASHANVQKVRLWRLSADGAHLVDFPSFSPFRCVCRVRVVVDSAGRIILAAGKVIVRLLPSGVRDASFGTGGLADVGIAITAVAASPSGVIAFAGRGPDGPRLARLLPTGRLDDRFGVASAPSGEPIDVAIQQDDKIVVGLLDTTGDGPSVLRYGLDGRLDPAYGEGGAVTGDVHVTALALQADGKVVVGGQAAGRDATVLRLLENGTPDASFGREGRVPAWPPVLQRDFVVDLTLQPDGGIVVVGVSGNCCFSRRRAWLAYRFDPAGGARRRGVGPGLEDTRCSGDGAGAVRAQRDGQIVVLGYGCTDDPTSQGNVREVSVVGRYRRDLTRDLESRAVLRLAPSRVFPGSVSLAIAGGVATARARIAVDEASRLELEVYAAARKPDGTLAVVGAPVRLRAGTSFGAATLGRPARSIAVASARAATLPLKLRFAPLQSRKQRWWVTVVRIHGKRGGPGELLLPLRLR